MVFWHHTLLSERDRTQIGPNIEQVELELLQDPRANSGPVHNVRRADRTTAFSTTVDREGVRAVQGFSAG
jgi:hypothetical protein